MLTPAAAAEGPDPGIDFERDQSGKVVPPGTRVDGRSPDFGVTVGCINNRDGHPNTCVIFDSSNPTGGDFDLGTPHRDFGGLGRGDGGRAGAAGENARPQGNVLVIAENRRDANKDGLVDDPDNEAAGGTIMLRFDTPTCVADLTVLDVDTDEANGAVIATNDEGKVFGARMAAAGNNGQQQVALYIPRVRELAVVFEASAALAGLTFCNLEQHDSGADAPGGGDVGAGDPGADSPGNGEPGIGDPNPADGSSGVDVPDVGGPDMGVDPSVDPGSPADFPDATPESDADAPKGSGCQNTSGFGGWWFGLLLMGLWWRRRAGLRTVSFSDKGLRTRCP